MITESHTSPKAPRTTRLARVSFAIALTALLAGCLSRPALKHQTFAFQTPAPNATSSNSPRGVLLLQSVDVSPLFARQPFVYRTGPESYEIDPYAGFLVTPDRAIAIPIRGCLGNSGAFSDVAVPGMLAASDATLQVFVSELYGDFRQPDQPAAVLSMRFRFVNSDGRVLLSRDYSQSVPLTKRNAAALMAGWNEALERILKQVVSDLSGNP